MTMKKYKLTYKPFGDKAILIEWDGFAYVIDCGPDFRQQMLRTKCDKINGILFTHEHADHVAGLDDIRPLCYMNGDMNIVSGTISRFDGDGIGY